MSEEFLEGWAIARLGDLATKIGSGATPRGGSSAYAISGTPLIRSQNVYFDGFRDVGLVFLDSRQAAALDGVKVQTADVFLNITGASIGRACIAPERMANARVNQHVAIIRPKQRSILPSLLAMYLESPSIQLRINTEEYGVTRQALTKGWIEDLEVPIPPLPEQHRIVEKVEALLDQVNRAKARLERVPLILKRFRQAVLAAACSGELTREWRESHPTVQPARDLLAAISARRTTLKLPTASRQIPDEGIEIPESELPDSWRWCRVGQIADVRLGGTPARKEPSYWNGSIPWVSSGEVANCRISGTAEQITKKGLENSNAKLYPAGSVLIAMIGEGKTRGQSAILDIDACTNQNVAGLIFDAGLVNPEYIWYWALQEYTKNREEGRGGNQAALNGAKVRALPLPLPPVNEQAEIVRVLKNMLRLASAIDARVNVATARANKLPQAILSKAFAGELVPTEAELARLEGRTYETAEELLKRVTALGSDAPSARKGRGRRTG